MKQNLSLKLSQYFQKARHPDSYQLFYPALSSYDVSGRLGGHERKVKKNSSFLSALQTSYVHHWIEPKRNSAFCFLETVCVSRGEA